MTSWLSLRLARRELRGGLRGFRIFLACLTLGVAAIATVQTVTSGILTSLAEDGRAILGGDIALRRIYEPPPADALAYLDQTAEVSRTREMRSMARSADGETTALVELKAVDGAYPLVGEVELSGGVPLAEALGNVDGRWGAALENSILARLDLEVGDVLELGDSTFEIRATIEHEPDRAGGTTFSIGPRLMIADAALAETGLARPGSMIYHNYRLSLPPGSDVAAYADNLQTLFPEAGWRVRDHRNAAPQLRQTIEQLAMFLTLVGLTALLVGGVGVGNAVKAFMDGKIATIGTLKTLGAPSGLIFRVYLAQVMILAGIGTAFGLVIGLIAPPTVGLLVEDVLPVEVRIGFYPAALATATAFGLLTALAFSLWPLARARGVPAASLFRDVVAPVVARPDLRFVLAVVVAVGALSGLAIVTAEQPWFAAVFVAGALAAVVCFRAAAWAIMRLSRRAGRPRRPGLRLALTNLHRPGAPTGDVVLSLGLGLTVLVAIALIEGNMSRQVQENIPDDAPTFFFVDIQTDQMDPIDGLVSGMDGVGELARVPSLRGRIVAANGVPAEEALINPEHAWVLNGDRGVTYTATQQAHHEVVEGSWWPEDYAGPPLLSVYRDIADAFGLTVGDTLTVNVLGRNVDAEIVNIREIDWSTLGINFTLVYSPSPLQSAPHTFIATVQTESSAENAVQRAVATSFPNVTSVRIRDALETVNEILRDIANAVRGTAGITLVAGTLVLAGAVAAGHRRRVYDAVVLKVLGATRGTVLRAFLLEYGLLGILTSAIAAVLGTVAAWAVLTYVMAVEWSFLTLPVLATAALCTAITLIAGFLGTWHALGQKAAPLLRNE